MTRRRRDARPLASPVQPGYGASSPAEAAQRSEPRSVKRGSHRLTADTTGEAEQEERMSTQPDMTPRVYTAEGPEQDILEALDRWARTSPWAARVAARKAREYSTTLERAKATR